MAGRRGDRSERIRTVSNIARVGLMITVMGNSHTREMSAAGCTK